MQMCFGSLNRFSSRNSSREGTLKGIPYRRSQMPSGKLQCRSKTCPNFSYRVKVILNITHIISYEYCRQAVTYISENCKAESHPNSPCECTFRRGLVFMRGGIKDFIFSTDLHCGQETHGRTSTVQLDLRSLRHPIRNLLHWGCMQCTSTESVEQVGRLLRELRLDKKHRTVSVSDKK